VFFKIAEGYGGYTQNLALFEASNTMFLDHKAVLLNSQETTLDHIALNVALEDFETEKMRLEGLGLKVNATLHEWHFVFARYISPTQRGVCWSLSLMMRVCDSIVWVYNPPPTGRRARGEVQNRKIEGR
jgi:hypothetical protein